MFDKADRELRTVSVTAQEHARRLGHRQIGIDHLLLALLHPVSAPVQEVLASVGIAPEALHRNVLEQLPPGTAGEEGGLTFDDESRAALANAEGEAERAGHDWVGTGHLLVAGLKVRDPRIDLDRLRPALARTRRAPDVPDEDEAFRRPSDPAGAAGGGHLDG